MTPDPRCPTCAIPVGEHEAGRCLDEWLATLLGLPSKRVRVRGTTDQLVLMWTDNPYFSDGAHTWEELKCHAAPPPCSQDDALAIGFVVPRLRARGWDHVSLFQVQGSDDWFAGLGRWLDSRHEADPDVASAFAPTLALGIARAAILALTKAPT